MRPIQAALLRDIVGNPFRADKDQHWPFHKRQRYCTPTVLSLAQAAYEERPGRKCENCNDGWVEDPEYVRMDKKCPNCNGTGRIDDGSLDPVRLSILADALEEAGCVGERIYHCQSDGTHDIHRHEGRAGQILHGVLHADDPRRYHHHHDEKCRRTDAPHPVLTHLRSPGPHVRGCWAVDCVLGKE